MSVSDTIAIVLVIAVLAIAVIVFAIKRIRRSRRIDFILEKHPEKTNVLLNREKVPYSSELSRDEEKTILSLTNEDLGEWDCLISRLNELGKQYPKSFYEFINESFPSIKYLKRFKKEELCSRNVTEKVKNAILSMTLGELRLLDAETEDTWKQRENLIEKADEIRQKYPDGYQTYCEIKKPQKPTNRDVVRSRKQIAEFQTMYDNSIKYEGWENKQKEFSALYRDILDDVRSQDGKYTYNITFNKQTRRGSLVESSFKVWQGFCEGFSSFLLDRQTESFKENFEKIDGFKKRRRYFYDRVYEDVFEIIKKVGDSVDGDLRVVFIDRCKQDWPTETYDYHYRHIRELMEENGFISHNLSELASINDDGNIGGVFILDFITTNDELKNNCKLIIEHFSKSAPLIGYYSMEKEYDEAELLNNAAKEDGYLEPDEEAYTGFIKDCLLEVNKHSFFTFLAITNTWIGTARWAEETKKIWLDNPGQYFFHTKEKKEHISGEYSIDGGANLCELTIEGSARNVDDVARYTYLLFKEMGLLKEFKNKGKNAIEFMNEKGFLAKHGA